ncbi:hypothetical protein TNCV_2237631 [Trichonephila clavipes]|nr:hypothetical protein TNCV_2237631 [Trichonephila clavipes]
MIVLGLWSRTRDQSLAGRNPGATKDSPCRGGRSMLSLSRFKRPPMDRLQGQSQRNPARGDRLSVGISLGFGRVALHPLLFGRSEVNTGTDGAVGNNHVEDVTSQEGVGIIVSVFFSLGIEFQVGRM